MRCTDTAHAPQLTFSSFHTESGYDFLYLFDDGGGLGYVTLHGTAVPPDPFVAAAGSTAYAQYESDGSVNRDGFSATFECVEATAVHDPDGGIGANFWLKLRCDVGSPRRARCRSQRGGIPSDR